MIRRWLRNPWVRWLLPLVILGVILWFLRDQLDFLRTGVSELRTANPYAVALATVVSVISIYAMSMVMRILLRATSVDVTRRKATALTFASNSWSATFPGGPAISAVFTFHVQRSWGASVVACSWFLVLSSALSSMWLVVLGIIGVFFLGANLSVGSLLASLIAMVVLCIVVYWAANNPEYLSAMVRKLMPPLNRLLRRDRDAGVDTLVRHINQLRTVTLAPWKFGITATWSLLNWLFDVAALWLCVWAVTEHLPGIESLPNNTTAAGVLLAYVTAKIAGTLQATPGGVGPVEAALIATLVATGLTAVDAAGAVIIYRLLSFILMTLVGWIVYFLYFTPKGINAREISQEEGNVPQ